MNWKGKSDKCFHIFPDLLTRRISFQLQHTVHLEVSTDFILQNMCLNCGSCQLQQHHHTNVHFICLLSTFKFGGGGSELLASSW